MILVYFLPQQSLAQSAEKSDKTLEVLQSELQRNFDVLSKLNPPVYFMAYRLYSTESATIAANNGLLMNPKPLNRSGHIQIEVRIGSPVLDNLHPLKTEVSSSNKRFVGSNKVPFEGDQDGLVLKQNLWLETEKTFRHAVKQYGQVLAEHGLYKEEDSCLDFSRESATKFESAKKQLDPLDLPALIKETREVSKVYANYPALEETFACVKAENIHRYLVNTEGTAVSDCKTNVTFTTAATSMAESGEQVQRQEARTFPSQKEAFANQAELEKLAEELASSVNDLRKAPIAEPFCGPAILSGSAAAVLFHEVLGHRLEASRLRDLADGKTFSKMLNKQIMPTFISVFDKPLMDKLNGISLVGHYAIDDEGVAAQDVTLVKDGVLVGYLMARRPVAAFSHSNGHGRCDGEIEHYPFSRMANLIVESSKVVTDSELRAQLIAEAKKKSKAYGLLIERVEAGRTFTSSHAGQLFQVHPSVVKRVYVDGRPDELVRGVRIVGTPLAALQHIIQCSDKTQVMNGVCGAQSGLVPQSNSSPSILIDYLETERQPPIKGIAKILPPPPNDAVRASNPDESK